MLKSAKIVVKIKTPVTEDFVKNLMLAFQAVAEVSVLSEYVDVTCKREAKP